jgi:glycosyltransferase involved in cell wall biosynthesis
VRVLHVTDHYPPVLGGIEAHVSALARRQAAHGYDVTVLTSTPASADGRHHADDGEVTVERTTLPIGLRFDFATFDVVHAHVSVVAPFTAPVAAVAARSGAPTVVTVHSLWNGLGPVPELAARVAGLRRAPVTWTAVSQIAARELERRLPAGTPVGLLPNAVDVRPRPRPAPRPGARPVRLVSTMRVARRKRPLALLEIYGRLRDSVEVPTDLTIVGDGPLRPRVERLVTRAGLEGVVTVTGRLDPAAVLVELARADIYVAPALLESFGLAALEARCVGLPVVGQATTGLTEFVTHGVEGLLGRDDADVGASLRLLVTDEGRRLRMSEHNRTTPSPMTWGHAMERHDAVYEGLGGRRPSRRTVASAVEAGGWS